MFNKLGKYLRRLHKYLTPFFVVITIVVLATDGSILIVEKIQKVLMLTLAVTGSYLYIQIYYNKYKNKNRKKKA